MKPGLHPTRLVALMHAAIERCQLDLSGRIILTEAATGAYVVTPVLAAMAGAASVYALTRATRYGTVEEIRTQTLALADLARVRDRIEVITQKTRHVVEQADVITNSGHVRPIDANTIAWMKPTAVIPLMYESWEFRSSDVDIEACRHSGIKVGGTNERHPAVDVFSFLGLMAIKLLADAGVAAYRSRILLLCDNAFQEFIAEGLQRCGAKVHTVSQLAAASREQTYDAILVALLPRQHPVLSAADVQVIARCWPEAVVAQFWGDLDRVELQALGVPVWPQEPPTLGHMGILLSEVGPEPIVRLQSGGLKVAELLSRTSGEITTSELSFIQMLDVQQ